MTSQYLSRHRLPRLSAPELATLRELCMVLPQFMPAVTLRGHRVTVLHLQAGPTAPYQLFPRHVHSTYEGHLVLAGTGWYTVSSTHQLQPGHVVLHRPELEHGWETKDARLDWLICWLQIDPVVPVPEPLTWPLVPSAVWEVALMVEDYRAHHPGWQERAIARMTTIVSYLLEVTELPEVIPRPPSADQLLLDAIERYLQQHLTHPLQAPDIAAYAGLSTRSLHRLYHRTMHQGVMTHLQTIRLLRAAQLLLTTDHTVTAISAQVGINETSYFCKLFRHYFHVSPQQYRKNGHEAPILFSHASQAKTEPQPAGVGT